MERKAFVVVQCLGEVWWLITKSKYLTKLYTNHFALKGIFTQGSDAHNRISCWIDQLTEYDYKVYHQPCKTNIMQIADKMSCFPAKYSQFATVIDLKRMVLTVALLYSWLLVLFTQVADLPVPELSYQAYQNSK